MNSLEDDEHVYFFFRESAVEHINCGKVWKKRISHKRNYSNETAKGT